MYLNIISNFTGGVNSFFDRPAGRGIRKKTPRSARFHKKTKSQNSDCKAASAALSGLAVPAGTPGWRSHESPSRAFDRPNRSALCADAARRFRAARLRPSALHLPLCSGFAMQSSSYRTFVFLCHSRFCQLRQSGAEKSYVSGGAAVGLRRDQNCAPRVAAMTALMVCMRFSASWKTMLCLLVKTSSVTSMASRSNFSPMTRPTSVQWSW